MALKYCIDKVVVRKRKYPVLIITGWAFDTQKEITLVSYINKKQVFHKFIIIPRFDIANTYKQYNINSQIGFCIVVPIDNIDNCSDYKLCVSSKKIKRTIIHLNKAKLSRLYTTTIFYEMEKIKLVNGNVVLQGWAVSNCQNSIDVSVNCEIITSFNLKKRDDLIEYGYCEKDEANCGFIISFKLVPKKKYVLTIKDSQNEIYLDLTRKIKEYTSSSVLKIIQTIFKKINRRNIKKGIKYISKYGFANLFKLAKRKISLYGMPYDDWFDAHQVSSEELAIQKNTHFNKEPLISILVPTYKTPIKYLKEMIESVKNQSYSNWELCVADGSEGDKELEAQLENYHKNDSRIIYKILDKNLGISDNTNACLNIATGEYVALFDHDDVLELNALYEIVNLLNQDDYDCIYTDEDKIQGDDLTSHYDPYFKPDFSQYLLESGNYITHFFAVKSSIVKSIGGFKKEYDGAQDYDLILRCSEKSSKIGHIAKQLYHWRIHEASTAGNPASKMYAYNAGMNALQSHFDRVGIKATVNMLGKDFFGLYKADYLIEGNPLVSIVIPNKDNIVVLKRCINSLKKSSYSNFEIIVVDNNSKKASTFNYYKSVKNEKIKVITCNQKMFNYSKLNNIGVNEAIGEYILLLNNDVEMLEPNALESMIGIVQQNDVGAVGAKLLFRDNTVEHCGIVVGLNNYAEYVDTGIYKNDTGFMIHSQINRNYSAVSAACMLTKKSLYLSVGGFNENLPMFCNEVDYCLKLRKNNKQVVYNAYSLWKHNESVTIRKTYNRKYCRTQKNKEMQLFNQIWKDFLDKGDPYYNKNFTKGVIPYKLI